MIEAKIICDSVNPTGQRLTTFQLRYPRFIHAEFMTHRRFSRNASSSRAVPTAKLLEEVRSDALRAAPVFWGKNQAGMQATQEADDTATLKALWMVAAVRAAETASIMMDFGAHKQIVNRLLEPFTHINVVCTATEYMNFFGLRLDAAAQPEMRALAEAMWVAYDESKPIIRKAGEWHLPYLVGEDVGPLEDHILTTTLDLTHEIIAEPYLALAIKVSVARCARVSYKSFYPGNERSTVEEDLALYDRLLGAQPLHASPAEHQATPDDVDYIGDTADCRACGEKPWMNPEQHGNFTGGWRQYRKMLPGESLAPLPKEYTA